tara:strand:+ start:919 stop:1194 length:276 start_codon:yes stop_codon:yes gene_type:complete
VEKYNSSVADNPKVAMIHISQDTSEDAAESWAVKEGFPWLTVLPGDVKRSDLSKYRTRPVVPFYTLVDASGNQLATGSGAVFAKAAEVGAQ